MQRNKEIRERAKKAGICLWQIADRVGLSDANFSRILRKELPPETKERVFQIIEELKVEVGIDLRAAQ